MSLKTKCKIFIKNKMVGSVVVYTFSAFLNSAVPFLILPLLTRYLSTDEYGIVSMFNATVGLITPFLSLGSSVAIQRKLVERDKAGNKEFIFNSFILVFSATFLMMLLFFMFKNNITHFTGIPRELLFYVTFYSFGELCLCGLANIGKAERICCVSEFVHYLKSVIISLFSSCIKTRSLGKNIWNSIFKIAFCFFGSTLNNKICGYKASY